jgi:hypothetical protein
MKEHMDIKYIREIDNRSTSNLVAKSWCSESKGHKGNQDADVKRRLRKGRIGEHRPQSETADNKPDYDQDDQSEEQVPHKGVNQDAAQINIRWRMHRLHPSRLMSLSKIP